MSHDLVISGAKIVTPGGVRLADLAIKGAQIAEIGENLQGQARFEADGLIAMPGGVDPHAHIEQMSGMGVMNADTFETATRSAALGGTTSVICFAAQQHGERLADRVADYTERAKAGAIIDYAFHLSISDIEVPYFDADFTDLVAAGHRSVKVFTTYNIALPDQAIAHVLFQARQTGALVCVHAENDGLIGWSKQALLSAGLTRPKHHAMSHPPTAEIEAVQRMIVFAEFFATPVMLFHISTGEALDAIRQARSRGVPVWAETCPHYLMMTEDVLDKPGVDGAKWMCSPPQRRDLDCAALWDGLQDGSLSLVSSDHAPYRFDKTGKLSSGSDARFDQIANGLPGLQTRLALLFDALVSHEPRDPVAFARLTAEEPARIYGLERKGRLEPGMDADLTLWDPTAEFAYGANDLADNVGYNPWEGRRIKGRPLHVLRRGDWIVRDGALVAKPGSGRWIARPKIGVAATHPPAREVQLIEETLK